MKKVILFPFIVGLFLSVSGQSYLRIDSVMKTHIQFDYQSWVDTDSHHPLILDNDHLTYYISGPILPGDNHFKYFSGDLVQYNYIEGGADIYGLAVWAVSSITGYVQQFPFFPMEYLYLYEAEPDTFMLMEQVWFNNLAPCVDYQPGEFPLRYNIPLNCNNPFEDRSDYNWNRKWEFYFNKPVHVEDSFYVGASDVSMWDGYYLDYSEEHPTLHHPRYGCFKMKETVPYNGIDCDWPSPMKIKVRWRSDPLGLTDPPLESLANDSVWGLRHNVWVNKTNYHFYMILPLIMVYDTVTIPDLHPCYKVSRFYMMSHFGDTTILRWQGDGEHNEWQISYGPAGIDPDSGYFVTCHDTRWTHVDTIHNGDTLTAYVRTVCREMDTLRYSDWSDGVTWHGQNVEIVVPQGDANVDRFIFLAPNPASGIVSVMSSYSVKSIEVYSARGELMMQSTGKATDRFSVEGWTPGIYVVLVVTEAGHTAKKLIVK